MPRRNSSQLPNCKFGTRRLRIEHLEERRLLATVTVSNNLDIVNGDTSTIDALVNEDGGDGISLREAIEAANNSPGADDINFEFGHDDPVTILLTTGELRIFEALTISGDPGLIIIDAQQNSRIMRIDNFATTIDDFEVTLTGLTLTGGHLQNVVNAGGAILANNLYLFINDSVIEGNYTSGSSGWGGAIFSEGYVTVTNSIFRDNYTTGNNAVGGAIFARGDVTLNDSIVTNNHTSGVGAGAGGVRSNGKVILLRSTVSGNWTEGDDARGGGIEAVGDIILTKSTVSGNSTLGNGSSGGGMFTFHGVEITQSTISGNSTKGSNAAGGGIRVSRQVSITQSTIADNWTEQSGTTGSGLYQTNYANNFPVVITGTIIAGNRADGGNADLRTDPESTKTVDYSLIGRTIGSGITATTGTGNLLNVSPALGPLADNGGPTGTHALLPGSLALDTGDPNFDPYDPDGDPMTADALPFDQRGMPYGRVADSDDTAGARIDIGAYEAQGIPEAIPGDYNRNGVVDAADYTVWRDSLGASDVMPLIGADGDGNGIVDAIDHRVWKSHFGFTYALPASAEAPAPAKSLIASSAQVAGDTTSATDAAFSVYKSPQGDASPLRQKMQPSRTSSATQTASYTPIDLSLLLLGLERETRDDSQVAERSLPDEASSPEGNSEIPLLTLVFNEWP